MRQLHEQALFADLTLPLEWAWLDEQALLAEQMQIFELVPLCEHSLCAQLMIFAEQGLLVELVLFAEQELLAELVLFVGVVLPAEQSLPGENLSQGEGGASLEKQDLLPMKPGLGILAMTCPLPIHPQYVLATVLLQGVCDALLP